jgi:hypothetical protein
VYTQHARTEVDLKLKLISSTILVMLLLPFSLKAQEPNSHFGGQFGQLISADSRPTKLYAGSGTFAVDRLPDPFRTILGMFDEGEVSLMYSGDGSSLGVQELYGARFVGEQDLTIWSGLYATGGFGAWAFANTAGGDFAEFSATFQAGFMAGDWDIHIGADWIHQDGFGLENDKLWAFAGVLRDM